MFAFDKINNYLSQDRKKDGLTDSFMKNIRNFSIIAHIDHGKSTLADRFIQFCGGLEMREMSVRFLIQWILKRNGVLRLRQQTAALEYKAKDGQIYYLNLIDTPGHVDFSYEVSRSLSACEGALLVVDASQGVEAQTVANCYTAIELGVEVVPVLNKIDLPAAEPERVIQKLKILSALKQRMRWLLLPKAVWGLRIFWKRLWRKFHRLRGMWTHP